MALMVRRTELCNGSSGVMDEAEYRQAALEIASSRGPMLAATLTSELIALFDDGSSSDDCSKIAQELEWWYYSVLRGLPCASDAHYGAQFGSARFGSRCQWRAY